MATNGTEETQPSYPTYGVGNIVFKNINEPKVFIMEDPVFMAITGIIVFFGIVFLVREIISRLKDRHYRHHRQTGSGRRRTSLSDQDTEPRVIPSTTPFSDDPPPYPGKYSKTNINYLPSYDSAIKMAPELRMCNINQMTPPAEFSVFEESVVLDQSDQISNEETENSPGCSPVCHEVLIDRECESRTTSDDQQVFSEDTECSPHQICICDEVTTLDHRSTREEEEEEESI